MAEEIRVMRVEGAEHLAGAWVRRGWCVWVAVGLVLLGAGLNLFYLFHESPIDFSQDESHYWMWSRHLDIGYYSKPPGIAWVLAGAEKVGGMLGMNGDGSGAALMPVLRVPAVVFGVISGVLSLLLARRLFRDDRAALAVIVLSAAVPMFAVGSLLITIDSPMYLGWSATVYCLWRVVEENVKRKTQNAKLGEGEAQEEGLGAKSWGVGWLYLAGVFGAVGMMFKPVLIALPLCVVVGMVWEGRGGLMRRAFGRWHAVGALVVMMSSQVPVVVWNMNHGWVTLRHMLTQGGLGKEAGAAKSEWWRPAARVGEYVGGQAGGMGGVMFGLLVAAVVVAWQRQRALGRLERALGGITEGRSESSVVRAAEQGTSEMLARARWVFLLSFTVPLWGFYLVMNLWKGTEVNWPAASYFTGMILLAGVFVEGWNAVEVKVRRGARVWGTVAVAWGILMTVVVMNLHRGYPMAAEKLKAEGLVGADGKTLPGYFKSWWHPAKWDVALRLRGFEERAKVVEGARKKLAAETGEEPVMISSRYDTSSSLTFYMPGHPFVYSVMSSVGGRQSQFDVWEGLNAVDGAGKVKLAGRPAVIVGTFEPWAMAEVIRPAFERLEGPEVYPMEFMGVVIKEVTVYRGYGFKGLPGGGSGGKGGVY